MKFFRLFLVSFFLMMSPSHGLLAKDVTMAFGEKIPPFCFPETNSGIEIEVIGESLAYKGHVLKPKYYPFGRITLAFKSGKVDAAMTDLGEDMTKLGAFYGDSAVVYDNVFITLKDRKIVINKPEDLKGLSVFAFQGALKRYPSWLKSVELAGKYQEFHDQKLQVGVLLNRRYDVVLSDRSIFKYHMLQYYKEKEVLPKEMQEHAFVKLNLDDYRPVFRSKEIRDDFNLGLTNLKKSGRFKNIYDKYLKDPKAAPGIVLACL